MRHPDILSELTLENVDVRAERRDPVRVEGIEQQPALFTADVGWRKKDSVHRECTRTGRAGTPTTVARGATSSTTTAPAPTVAHAPIILPGSTTAPMPINAPSPTSTSPPRRTPGAI